MSRFDKSKPPLFKFLIISLLIGIIGFLLVLILVAYMANSSWYNSNISNINPNFVHIESSEIKKSLENKITKLSQSEANEDYIELSEDEFALILFESLQDALPSKLRYERGFVMSNKGYVQVYVQLSFFQIKMPWLYMKLEKDNIQTVQFYVSEMVFSGFNISKIGSINFMNRFNKGISQAIAVVSQSDFTGRVFINIEFEQGSIILKARK